MGLRGFGKCQRRRFDLTGPIEQLLPGRRQRVPCLPLVEEREAERRFQSGDAPRDRRLADVQGPASGQGAALTRDGEKMAQVVPVHHGVNLTPMSRSPGSAISQNNSTRSLLPREDNW